VQLQRGDLLSRFSVVGPIRGGQICFINVDIGRGIFRVVLSLSQPQPGSSAVCNHPESLSLSLLRNTPYSSYRHPIEPAMVLLGAYSMTRDLVYGRVAAGIGESEVTECVAKAVLH
jgi:hypothetical protein